MTSWLRDTHSLLAVCLQKLYQSSVQLIVDTHIELIA